MRFSTLSGLITAAAISVQAIPTIHSKGSKFFDSNGNQFYIKGIPFFNSLYALYITHVEFPAGIPQIQSN